MVALGAPWVDLAWAPSPGRWGLVVWSCWTTVGGWALKGAGRGNRTANRVSVSPGKNGLKRLAGSGFRGFNILEDVSFRNAPSGVGADRNTTTAGVPVYIGSSMGATPP